MLNSRQFDKTIEIPIVEATNPRTPERKYTYNAPVKAAKEPWIFRSLALIVMSAAAGWFAATATAKPLQPIIHIPTTTTLEPATSIATTLVISTIADPFNQTAPPTIATKPTTTTQRKTTKPLTTTLQTTTTTTPPTQTAVTTPTITSATAITNTSLETTTTIEAPTTTEESNAP